VNLEASYLWPHDLLDSHREAHINKLTFNSHEMISAISDALDQLNDADASCALGGGGISGQNWKDDFPVHVREAHVASREAYG
jgi:hypothetical protein